MIQNQDVDETWSSASVLPPLSGTEPFEGLDATVRDFWRLALSDLRTNNTRGYLAAFLVAKAVGATAGRVECDAFGVLAPSGALIEVKSSRTSGLGSAPPVAHLVQGTDELNVESASR